MNVLMLYPKFPDADFLEYRAHDKASVGAEGDHAAVGLLTIASYLPEDFSLRLVDRNVAEESEADWEWADVVFLSVMMAQREDYRACVANAKMHGKPIAVGGPFTHALPEEACADADWICFGEAENIMDDLVRRHARRSPRPAVSRRLRYEYGAGQTAALRAFARRQ